LHVSGDKKMMKYKNILITGGAGFVGSNLAIKLRENYPNINIFCVDNLRRRGSELNINRLIEHKIKFIHGDIRNKEDLSFENIDLILECSAEPSVLAGVNSSPEYVINTNLIGAINCFELARAHQADFIFLSTSRVYSTKYINSLKYKETETRFELLDNQEIPGASKEGISETFTLLGSRSIYGATKLASELILQEYIENYGIKGIINRCGVITGPWQMGKVEQGVIALWMARHIFERKLSYIGYDGTGKQVRDFIHIDDLFELLNIQINALNDFNGEVYNVGGGVKNSVSLLELTNWCQKITGNKITINSIKEDRAQDIRIYISDCNKIIKESGWNPRKGIEETLTDIYEWIIKNKANLLNILQ
jgi:CDP-paratose 2-epimerase